MSTEETTGIDFRQYLAVLRRHVLVILVLTLAFGVGAYAYASSQTPMYEASALLLYEPQLDVTDPLSGAGYGNVDGPGAAAPERDHDHRRPRARQARAARSFRGPRRAVLGDRHGQLL